MALKSGDVTKTDWRLKSLQSPEFSNHVNVNVFIFNYLKYKYFYMTIVHLGNKARLNQLINEWKQIINQSTIAMGCELWSPCDA